MSNHQISYQYQERIADNRRREAQKLAKPAMLAIFGFLVVGFLFLIVCAIFSTDTGDINEMSLSSSQQKSIYTALKTTHFKRVEMHGAIGHYITVESEHSSTGINLYTQEVTGLHVNSDLNCPDLDTFSVTRNEQLRGGISLRVYGFDKRCADSETVTSYLISLIELAKEEYSAQVKTQSNNKDTYQN